MISRRSLLSTSAVGAVALAAAVATRELPAMASDANGDPSDNLEQKRDRQRNRKERRRDRRRRNN